MALGILSIVFDAYTKPLENTAGVGDGTQLMCCGYPKLISSFHVISEKHSKLVPDASDEIDEGAGSLIQTI